MPSIRRRARRRRAPDRPDGSLAASRRTVAIAFGAGLCSAAVLAYCTGPHAAPSAAVSPLADAGPIDPPDARRAQEQTRRPRAARPLAATPPPPDAAPASVLGNASVPPPRDVRRRTARPSSPPPVSLQSAVAAEAAAHPAPAPDAPLCTLPANALIGLYRTAAITTEVGLFETYTNPDRVCGQPLDLALELSGPRLIVNGLYLDRRPACFADFSTTVIERDAAEDRAYALWLLPQGGQLTSCPSSHTLSTQSLAMRTPRHNSSSSPSQTSGPTLAPPRPQP